MSELAHLAPAWVGTFWLHSILGAPDVLSLVEIRDAWRKNFVRAAERETRFVEVPTQAVEVRFDNESEFQAAISFVSGGQTWATPESGIYEFTHAYSLAGIDIKETVRCSVRKASWPRSRRDVLLDKLDAWIENASDDDLASLLEQLEAE